MARIPSAGRTDRLRVLAPLPHPRVRLRGGGLNLVREPCSVTAESSSEQSWAQSFDRRPASRPVVAGSHMDECAVAGNPVSEPNGDRGCAFQTVEGLQVQMRFSAVAGIAATSDLVTGPDPVAELHLRASSLQVTECDDGRSAVDHDVVAGECPPPSLDPFAL